jgi:hypothetical protein
MGSLTGFGLGKGKVRHPYLTQHHLTEPNLNQRLQRDEGTVTDPTTTHSDPPFYCFRIELRLRESKLVGSGMKILDPKDANNPLLS